jgi:hypothetical protein
MTTRDDARTSARRLAQHLLSLRDTSPGEAPAQRGAAPAADYHQLLGRLQGLDGLLRLHRAAARATADRVAVDEPDEPRPDEPRPDEPRPDEPGPDEPADEPDRALAFVRKAHRLLLEHPVAGRHAYAALAREGRAYAATPEGAAVRDRLLRSRRLRRASLLWRSLTMGMLDDDDRGELPSSYLDHLLRAVDRPDLERLLGQLHLEREAPRKP